MTKRPILPRGFALGATVMVLWVVVWIPLWAASDATAPASIISSTGPPRAEGASWLERVETWLPALGDITPQQMLTSFALILFSLILRRVLMYMLISRVRALTERTKTKVDEALIDFTTKPLGWLVVVLGIYAAVAVLRLPEGLELVLSRFIRSVIIGVGAWLLIRMADAMVIYLSELSERTDSKLDDQLVPLLRRALKVFIGLMAAVMVVYELGYNVSSLVAGLGLGGLALALAAQDTLGNLFGSIVIFLDRPFRVGDWIVSGDVEGVVEEVGFRSTRIRTFAKTLVSMPNSKLAGGAITNWSRMPIRRVKMTIGVTYESSAQQMEQAVENIRKILREHPGVDQKFFMVNFTDFGENSLNIFLYYFTKTTVWEEYLRVRQEVNLAIMRMLEGLSMEIAFPSRSVYIRDGKGGAFESRLPDDGEPRKGGEDSK